MPMSPASRILQLVREGRVSAHEAALLLELRSEISTQRGRRFRALTLLGLIGLSVLLVMLVGC